MCRLSGKFLHAWYVQCSFRSFADSSRSCHKDQNHESVRILKNWVATVQNNFAGAVQIFTVLQIPR